MIASIITKDYLNRKALEKELSDDIHNIKRFEIVINCHDQSLKDSIVEIIGFSKLSYKAYNFNQQDTSSVINESLKQITFNGRKLYVFYPEFLTEEDKEKNIDIILIIPEQNLYFIELFIINVFPNFFTYKQKIQESNLKIVLVILLCFFYLLLIIILYLHFSTSEIIPNKKSEERFCEFKDITKSKYYTFRKAQDTQYNRSVVLKEPKSKYKDDSNHICIKALKDEYDQLNKIKHRNIVEVFEFDDKRRAIIMEYINGKNISEIMKKVNQGLDIDLAVYLVLEICEGLEFALSRDAIHPDFSPDNILVSFEGNIKIIDFGTSRFVQGKAQYNYINQGELLTEKSNIYSLGIIFYEILTNYRITQKYKIIPLEKKDNAIPDGICSIVNKCLEENTNKKYKSIQEIKKDLINQKDFLNIKYNKNSLIKYMNEIFNN